MLERAWCSSAGKNGEGSGEWEERGGLVDDCNSRFVLFCMT